MFALEEHLARLYRSAERVNITMPTDVDTLTGLVRSLATRCEAETAFVYVQCTRGVSVPRDHLFPKTPAKLWISVSPKPLADPNKRKKLVRVADTRYSLCDVKTLNLLPNVLAAEYAAENGGDDAIFCQGEIVNEGAHCNIHALKNGTLLSPPPGSKVLGGIARKHLLAACEKIGIPVIERHFTVSELLSADEVYLTSAGTLLSPCASFDGAPIGGNAPGITEKLQKMLFGEFYATTD